MREQQWYRSTTALRFTISPCDKNILYAPIPQTIQYGRPELCALILADPHAQNIFAAVQIKADGNAHCFLYDPPFTTDMVVDIENSLFD